MFFHMVYKSGQIFLPFCHNPRVWQTDGRTDGRTDRRTDRILITIPRLHYMQLGKNRYVSRTDRLTEFKLGENPSSAARYTCSTS